MKTVIFRYFLFVYGCAESLFLSGLSIVAASTGYSWLQHSDLSLQRLLLPQSADSTNPLGNDVAHETIQVKVFLVYL